MDRTDLKQLTTLLVALAGVASAVGSCNQSAQERVKADNKIYTTLAEAQAIQAKDIMNVHNEISELRGYLEAVRTVSPPKPEAESLSTPASLRRLTPLSGIGAGSGSRLGGATLGGTGGRSVSAGSAPSAMMKPEPLPLLLPLPPAAPAPVLKRLPNFSEL